MVQQNKSALVTGASRIGRRLETRFQSGVRLQWPQVLGLAPWCPAVATQNLATTEGDSCERCFQTTPKASTPLPMLVRHRCHLKQSMLQERYQYLTSQSKGVM
jgi:hypothetical protein